MTPKIIERNIQAGCSFEILQDAGGLKLRDIQIALHGGETPFIHGNNCFIAVRRTLNRRKGIWSVEQIWARVTDEKTAIYINSSNQEICFYMAYPIDPRMTHDDIEGADIIEPNATNDGWIFKHSQPGPHHDHFLAVRSAITTQFQPYLDASLIKRFEATNNRARTQAQTKYKDLCDFRDLVILEAEKAEQSEILGHFHRDPHPSIGHLHDAIKAGLASAKTAWAATTVLVARYRNISAEANALITRFGSPHTPETRWEKEARLEAERLAAEEAKKKAEMDATATCLLYTSPSPRDS